MTIPLGDTCPACITLARAVTCYPVLVQSDGDEGIKAHYRCPECCHRWVTGWHLGALEELHATEDAA